jgi:hypothetical protein
MKENKKNDLKQRIKDAAQAGYAGVIDDKQEQAGKILDLSSVNQVSEDPMIIPEVKEQPTNKKTDHGKKKIKTKPVKSDRQESLKINNSIQYRVKKIKEPKEKKQVKTCKKERTKRDKQKSRRPSFFAVATVFLCILSVMATITIGKIIASERDPAVTHVDSFSPKIQKTIDNANVQMGALETSADGEQERLNALAEDSRVYCIISSSPYFPDVNSKGSLYISNPEQSKYYTQVVIKTVDDKEIYISPLLAPNEKIEYDYLTDKDISEGSHSAYAYFNYYVNSESSSYLGSMCAEIKLVINN